MKIIDLTHPDLLLCNFQLLNIEYQKYGNIWFHKHYKLIENTSFQSPLKIQIPSLCTYFSADSQSRHDITWYLSTITTISMESVIKIMAYKICSFKTSLVLIRHFETGPDPTQPNSTRGWTRPVHVQLCRHWWENHSVFKGDTSTLKSVGRATFDHMRLRINPWTDWVKIWHHWLGPPRDPHTKIGRLPKRGLACGYGWSRHLSCFLPAGSARRAALPVFRLLRGRFWGFSPRRGDTLHRSRSNLAGRSLPNLTLIGSGVGVYGPQNWKKFEFYQYNCL